MYRDLHRLLSIFYLASLATSSSLDKPRLGFLETVLTSSSRAANSDSTSSSSSLEYCQPTGQIQDACCDFESVEQVNRELFETLHQLVETNYFRYHKVDLYKECPFWQEQGSCMNRACGVETTEEDHLPEEWRSYNLGKLNQSNDSKLSSPVGCRELKDSEFCVLEDELDSEGVYVDLIENPERFTGYAGTSSTRVWKAIYQENCFSPVPFIDPSRPSFEPGGTGFASLTPPAFHSSPYSSPSNPFSGLTPSVGGGVGGGWGEDEKRLVGSLAGPRDQGDEETCLEKRVFYKVISGLHASISTHICDDYLDQTTGKWSPNLECFITRIGQHPERLENMYFTYVLLLRALSRSGPSLLKTLNETAPKVTGSQPTLDRQVIRAETDRAGGRGGGGGGEGRREGTDQTRMDLTRLVSIAKGCPETFDESSMFIGPQAQILKTEFKQHFRNVSMIMDCVGCDKCRLWGKIQVTGLGTALKLLFSSEDENELVVLSRSEAVAFINTLHRLSESLAAVDKFRTLWAKRGQAVEEVKEGNREPTEGMPKVEEQPLTSRGIGRRLEYTEEESDENRVTPRFAPADTPRGRGVPGDSAFDDQPGKEEPESLAQPITEDSIEIQDAPTPTTATTFVGNLTTLPLFCARAIWTKLVDLCDFTVGGFRRNAGVAGSEQYLRGEL